jgi:hypothetical protein
MGISPFLYNNINGNKFTAGGGGGGGGGALGDATFWGTFATYADLDTIPAGDIRIGDSAVVTDVDGNGSLAELVYAFSWKIKTVVCDDLATLNAIDPLIIFPTAAATIPTNTEISSRYVYDGSIWERTPAGTSFQFPTLSSIGDLSTILDPLQDDTVFVIDTPFAVGKFRYNGTDWQLNLGVFTSYSQMTDYSSTPIETACLGFVEESGDTTENCVVYFYESGTWERSAALTSGYTWTSTNIADIDNPDPSGIGVTKPGDYLRLVLASGNRLFRLKRFTTAGGDVKNVDVWVPADWLESGTVKLWSYLVGNEANRIGSGFTDTIAGGGSPSITGDVSGSGYTRLQSGSGGSSAQLVSTSLSLGVGQQIYMRAQMRGAAAGANAAAGPYSGDGTNVSYAQMYNSTAFQFHEISGADLNTTTLRSGGSILPNTSATGDFIEMLDEGRTVLASIYRSGALYHTAKRNQATLGGGATAFAAASGGVLDVRYVVVITRTP